MKGADVKTVKAGDVELSFYTRGTGDPLIMIMGFRGTMAVWDPAFLEILEKKYKLILFDNRGVGFSTDTVENSTTIEQMADDTALLMKALSIDKAHILGWSMGSMIAMELAIKNPQMVDHLILCSPSPSGKFRVEGKSADYEKLTADVLTPEEALKLIFPVTELGKTAAESYYHRLMAEIALGTVPNDIEVKQETVKRQVQALVLWNKNNLLYEQLAGIKSPTLVAGGTSDDIDPPKNVQIVASRIPFAWVAYFLGSGHNFLSQDHEKFANLILLFTDSNK